MMSVDPNSMVNAGGGMTVITSGMYPPNGIGGVGVGPPPPQPGSAQLSPYSQYLQAATRHQRIEQQIQQQAQIQHQLRMQLHMHQGGHPGAPMGYHPMQQHAGMMMGLPSVMPVPPLPPNHQPQHQHQHQQQQTIVVEHNFAHIKYPKIHMSLEVCGSSPIDYPLYYANSFDSYSSSSSPHESSPSELYGSMLRPPPPPHVLLCSTCQLDISHGDIMLAVTNVSDLNDKVGGGGETSSNFLKCDPSNTNAVGSPSSPAGTTIGIIPAIRQPTFYRHLECAQPHHLACEPDNTRIRGFNLLPMHQQSMVHHRLSQARARAMVPNGVPPGVMANGFPMPPMTPILPTMLPPPATQLQQQAPPSQALPPSMTIMPLQPITLSPHTPSIHTPSTPLLPQTPTKPSIHIPNLPAHINLAKTNSTKVSGTQHHTNRPMTTHTTTSSPSQTTTPTASNGNGTMRKRQRSTSPQRQMQSEEHDIDEEDHDVDESVSQDGDEYEDVDDDSDSGSSLSSDGGVGSGHGHARRGAGVHVVGRRSGGGGASASSNRGGRRRPSTTGTACEFDDDEPKPKRTRAKKDPTAPKRPASNYMFWCTFRRPQLKALEPDVNSNVLMRRMALEWKSMNRTPEVMKRWDSLHERDQARYRRQMAQWRATGTYTEEADLKTEEIAAIRAEYAVAMAMGEEAGAGGSPSMQEGQIEGEEEEDEDEIDEEDLHPTWHQPKRVRRAAAANAAVDTDGNGAPLRSPRRPRSSDDDMVEPSSDDGVDDTRSGRISRSILDTNTTTTTTSNLPPLATATTTTTTTSTTSAKVLTQASTGANKVSSFTELLKAAELPSTQ